MKAQKLKVKVCGMREAANISALTALPIDYIGFIFYAKSSRYVNEEILINIPSSIKKTGVFVNSSLEEIKQKINQYNLQAVQLHGNESPSLCQQVHDLGVETFKAFGISEDFDWKNLADYTDVVDYFLFDTKSEAYGGTGNTFNWKRLKENPYNKPYLLSGGISLDNIEEAINFEDERLIGLDLNSKFEIKPAFKDIELITQALSKIKQ